MLQSREIVGNCVPALRGICIAKKGAGGAQCKTGMAGKTDYTIGIAGSGRMGTDIFYFLSDHDFPLVWLCVSDSERERQERLFMKKIDRRQAAGVLDAPARSSLVERTTITSDIRGLASADIVIEAITEDENAKRSFFRELSAVVGREAVMASNTSSIRPSLLADPDMGRERFAGLHFFYPVKLKNIAEIIRSDHTSGRSLDMLKRLLKTTGKPFLEMHENDGFILNRIFLDLQAEAWRCCERGLAGPRCIDSIVREDLFPSGVFGMFDAIGLDVVCASVEHYAEYGGDASFYGPLIGELRRLVALGRLGRKSGEGFYRYNGGGDDDAAPCGEAVRREISSVLLCLYINSACRALETGICDRDRLEHAIMECAAADRGPFALLDETGADAIRERLAGLYERTGFGAYRPSRLL